jgi:uridine kinase
MENLPVPDVVAEIAEQLLDQPCTGVLRVAVDGVDGVGKTTFADRLSGILVSRGRPTIRASVDGFHNPREYRYRLGRSSPEGFYRDSYDYPKFISLLLEPLSPGGSRLYRTAAFDHRVDEHVDAPVQTAPEDAIFIVDGIFLQREELRCFWDVVVFLDAPFEVTVPRGASRGPDFGSPDPDAISNRRYVEGQRLYFTEVGPWERATVVVDYSDLACPAIMAWRP